MFFTFLAQSFLPNRHLENDTVGKRETTRLFGAARTSGFVILAAGRQPGCLVRRWYGVALINDPDGGGVWIAFLPLRPN